MEKLNNNKNKQYSAQVDSREITWGSEILDSGLKEFSYEDYSDIAKQLLGIKLSKDQIAEMSSIYLKPYFSNTGNGDIFPDRPSIMMHWANRASAFLETDKKALADGKTPGGYDINISDRALVMTQEGNNERPGDIAVQRGVLRDKQIANGKTVQIDRDNLFSKNIKVLNASNLEFYNSSDAMLIEAQKRNEGKETELNLLIDFVSKYPESLFRIYASDTPTQLLLLYVLNEVKKNNPEVTYLNIEANSPEISSMNRKDVMYPSIDNVKTINTKILKTLGIDLSNLNKYSGKEKELIKKERIELLNKEADMSELGKLGVYKSFRESVDKDILTYSPGYSISINNLNQSKISKEEYTDKALSAFNRLKDVYGLEKICFRWTRASDGEYTYPRIPTDKKGESQIKKYIDEAYNSGQDIILVANASYIKSNDSRNVDLTPSVHILGGYAAQDVLTEQTLVNGRWIGNGVMNRDDFIELAGSDTKKQKEYAKYFDSLMNLNEVLANSLNKKGIAMAGNDFGIFNIGGIFDKDTFVAIQDNNWRFTGAFLAYASQELAKEKLGNDISTITRVIDISSDGNYDNIKSQIDQINNKYRNNAYANIITITPGWSMVSISTKGTQSNARSMMDDVLIKQLQTKSLIK